MTVSDMMRCKINWKSYLGKDDFYWISDVTTSIEDNKAVKDWNPSESFTLFCSISPLTLPFPPLRPSSSPQPPSRMGRCEKWSLASPTEPARQIDIIRQSVPGLFFFANVLKCPIFCSLAFFLPPSSSLSVPSAASICFPLAGQTNLGTKRRSVAPRRVRSRFALRLRGECVWGRGSGVREHVGVDGRGQRSPEYKPLPHAPRTAGRLVFPAFKRHSRRREVAITPRAVESLVFPASLHTVHIWSQATCSYNGT